MEDTSGGCVPGRNMLTGKEGSSCRDNDDLDMIDQAYKIDITVTYNGEVMFREQRRAKAYDVAIQPSAGRLTWELEDDE